MNILFLGNDASRTGAPIGLLQLFRELRHDSTVDFRLVLRTGGPLVDDYRALCDVVVYADLWNNLTGPQRIARRLGQYRWGGQPCLTPLEQMYLPKGVDVVYANTVAVGGLVGDLAALRAPVIVHVHELESVIAKYGRGNFRRLRRRAAAFVAASGAVRDNLVQSHGIPGSAITVIHESIPVLPARSQPDPAVQHIRSTLAIPPDAFVVGGCGGDPIRKGIDLFAAVADRVCRRAAAGANVHFLWIGEPDAAREKATVAAFFDKAEASSRIHWIGGVDDPRAYLAAMDVFVSASREDPFPLACLEAASLRKPIICFRGSGGIVELIEEDAGICAPYLDCDAMAACILQLVHDPRRVDRLGRCAAEKVATRYNASNAAQRVLELIHRVAIDAHPPVKDT